MRWLLWNRLLWAAVLIGVAVGAWFTGERVLYLSAAVLFVLPFLSLLIALIALRFGVAVSCDHPRTVTKYSQEIFTVVIHNRTPLPIPHAQIYIAADSDAISIGENEPVILLPFKRGFIEITFAAAYRGHFGLGLAGIAVLDISGLFLLRKKFAQMETITSLPLVADTTAPFAANLLTEASAKFNIRDEDYSTVSDIRQYLPTDSIKRVHWKLTAKRNEWLVKNFQSNALNVATIILDIGRLSVPLREMYAVEDAMVENALGLAKFCLAKGMPVYFIAGEKIEARTPAEFQVIYEATSQLKFRKGASGQAVLSQTITETTGYVNAVILTANISGALYQSAAKARASGHAVCVLYFPAPSAENYAESEKIFTLLSESGIPSRKQIF